MPTDLNAPVLLPADPEKAILLPMDTLPVEVRREFYVKHLSNQDQNNLQDTCRFFRKDFNKTLQDPYAVKLLTIKEIQYRFNYTIPATTTEIASIKDEAAKNFYHSVKIIWLKQQQFYQDAFEILKPYAETCLTAKFLLGQLGLQVGEQANEIIATGLECAKNINATYPDLHSALTIAAYYKAKAILSLTPNLTTPPNPQTPDDGTLFTQEVQQALAYLDQSDQPVSEPYSKLAKETQIALGRLLCQRGSHTLLQLFQKYKFLDNLVTLLNPIEFSPLLHRETHWIFDVYGDTCLGEIRKLPSVYAIGAPSFNGLLNYFEESSLLYTPLQENITITIKFLSHPEVKRSAAARENLLTLYINFNLMQKVNNAEKLAPDIQKSFRSAPEAVTANFENIMAIKFPNSGYRDLFINACSHLNATKIEKICAIYNNSTFAWLLNALDCLSSDVMDKINNINDADLINLSEYLKKLQDTQNNNNGTGVVLKGDTLGVLLGIFSKNDATKSAAIIETKIGSLTRINELPLTLKKCFAEHSDGPWLDILTGHNIHHTLPLPVKALKEIADQPHEIQARLSKYFLGRGYATCNTLVLKTIQSLIKEIINKPSLVSMPEDSLMSDETAPIAAAGKNPALGKHERSEEDTGEATHFAPIRRCTSG